MERFHEGILDYLGHADKASLLSTNKTTRAELFPAITEINIKAVMIPWLRSNIKYLTGVKKIVIPSRILFESLQSILRILNQGTFKLTHLEVHSHHNPIEYREFFQKNNQFLFLYISKAVLVHIKSPTPLVQNLNISHDDYRVLNTPVIRFFRQPLKYLKSVSVVDCSQEVCEQIFQNLLQNGVYIQHFDFDCNTVDHITPEMSQYIEKYDTRLRSVHSSNPSTTDILLQFLIVPSVRSIRSPIINKHLLESIKIKCPKLEILETEHIYCSKKFAEFIKQSQLIELKGGVYEDLSREDIVYPKTLHTMDTYGNDGDMDLQKFKLFLKRIEYSEIKNLALMLPNLYGACVRELCVFLSKKKDLRMLNITNTLKEQEAVMVLNLLMLNKNIEHIELWVNTNRIGFIATFMMNMPTLKHLKIYTISDYFENDEEIIVETNKFIDFFEALDIRMPHLETLMIAINLYNTNTFTSVMANRMKRRCPNLKKVTIGWSN